MPSLKTKAQMAIAQGVHLPVLYTLISLVSRLELAPSHSGSLIHRDGVLVNIKAAVHILRRAERGQSLGLHIAEVTIRANKVGTP